MYRFYLLYCLFLCLGNILFAQTTGFEKGVPQSFCTVQSNELSSSEEFYKEGKRSLAWQFSPRSVLTVKLDTPLHLDSISKEKRGITLWIYNEQARKDSLRFEFFSPTGHVSYRFGFRLNAQGWRACWIGFAHMKEYNRRLPYRCSGQQRTRILRPSRFPRKRNESTHYSRHADALQ